MQHESWFQSVLQYGMGVAQLWRDHNAALINVRRSRGEELDCHRSEHDTRNQTREANLDLVLDHMRQAPNEEVRSCPIHYDVLMTLLLGPGQVPSRGYSSPEGHC